jgi:hypothetical protein
MRNEGMPGSSEDLLRACEAAHSAGSDFPTVWNALLKRHPLVIGLPMHESANGEARIVIRLITGQKLLSSARGFSLG